MIKSFTSCVFSAIFLFMLSNPAFADVDDDFHQLKDSGENYEVTGAVCEQVARLRLREQYPSPQYDVRTGIAYGDKSMTIGELDVVVFENATDRAVVVAEVKCWKNLSSAKKKAKEQQDRFLRTIKSGAPVYFFSTYHKESQYQAVQFASPVKLISISQSGGKEKGFDISLSYSLDELMQLRQRLIKCQDQGVCRRPNGV